MKRLSVILLIFLPVLVVYGQERNFDKMSYGFQLSRFQDEFGLGIHVLTPEVKHLRATLKGNMNWLSHLDEANNETWSKFFSAQFGINFHDCITPRINLYSEGGIVSLFPNDVFSDESVRLGGYGLFGFEFFFTENTPRNSSYFIELGGIGTGARANKLSSNPLYANGFLIAVGFRF